MDVSAGLWAGTIAVLIALIVADFFIGGRKPHEVSIKEAGVWTTVWVVLAGLFGCFVWGYAGSRSAVEFFAGYVTEKSLSVDNLFVFILIMGKFAVPRIYQQWVLMFGVVIALVLRAVFIAGGAALVERFSWVFYLFGAFLVWTAVKLLREAGQDKEAEEYHEGRLMRLIRRRVPSTDEYHGTRLFVRVDGRRLMTPMMTVMLAIGTTDLLFALDSIPAIFGLTQDAYIVFTANAFALMGLRQLYFLIGGLLTRLVYLSYGLSVILGFIGVKLILHALHESGVHVPEIGIAFSLGFIVVVLVVTTAASLLASRRRDRAAGA
ncbi:tellurite resistance protein TerC [Kitasatospora sp. SolWspMP-SS2h]|uniref:TerC family protein n=1 Tax=Kitasatospora sp. SolWspMP-SS2h TaxID=1305729 RepID=UPI000DB9AEBB|nr:TerC family protein [Kitasatospora sp. SolWspMP-SS2h]RAJ45543.1 tellurite resistance protein TerC [Kitasatospora sp. SolWspMP-SS2h]